MDRLFFVLFLVSVGGCSSSPSSREASPEHLSLQEETIVRQAETITTLRKRVRDLEERLAAKDYKARESQAEIVRLWELHENLALKLHELQNK